MIYNEARITIYKNCKIIAEKNFKVDNIEDYLETLETLDMGGDRYNQFFKHALKTSYKIEFEQRLTDFRASDFNYMKLIREIRKCFQNS